MNIGSSSILECNHKWIPEKRMDNKKCAYCNWYPSIKNRAKCSSCLIEACFGCIKKKYNIHLKPKPPNSDIPNLELRNFKNRITILEDTNKLILQRLENLEQAQQVLTPNSDSSFSFKNSEEQRHFKHILQDSRQFIEVCNYGRTIKTISVYCKIHIGKISIEYLGVVDTGCTSTTIDIAIIPPEYIKKAPKPTRARQFDGSILSYEDILIPSKISFRNSCNEYSKPYNLPTTWVSSKIPLGIVLVLGLNFILDNNGGVIK